MAALSAPAEVEEFRVTVEGPGFKLDRAVGSNAVAQITALILGGALLQPPATRASGRLVSEGDVVDLDDNGGSAELDNERATDQTLGEYLVEIEPKTVVDKITAVGEFLYLTENMHDFSTDDFKQALVNIRDDIPKNLPRDFGTAVKSRYISKQSGSDKRYVVTKTGRAALENHFPRAARKRAASKSSK